MLLRERELAIELRILQALKGRLLFSPEMERQLWNSESGQMGERAFDCIGAEYENDLVRMNDLVLSADGKLCQVDALYICDGVLYLFEVKNWSGAFRLNNGEFLGGSACPLAQLNRSRKILERVLWNLRISVPVEMRLVFMGPGVCLYGLRQEDPILMAHQLPKFFEGLRRQNRRFIQRSDIQLGERLVQCHVADNPYRKLPPYSSKTVASGIMCPNCRVAMRPYHAKNLICGDCGFNELKKNSLRRSITELDLLFPLEKQRVHQIYQWCDGLVSKRLIHKQLGSKESAQLNE